MTAPRALPAPQITEADWQRQVVQLAEMTGWCWLHVRTSQGRRNGQRAWQTTTNLKGWCDLLLWKPGRVIAAELKSEKGRTTPEQDDVLASLAATGLIEVHVWRPADLDEVAAVLGRRT